MENDVRSLLKNEFSLLISEKRKYFNETQAKFADRVGLCEKSIRNIEKSKKLPDVETIYRFVKKGIITIDETISIFNKVLEMEKLVERRKNRVVKKMIYYVFKLDQYYSDSQKHYRFAEGLFEYTRLRKKKTIESVGVNYSAYRVEKFREDVRNDNINKIIEFFGYKKIEEDDIIIYETLFTKVYYCCYYGNIKSYDFYLKQIEDLMQKKDIVYPILVLFKVFFVL